MLGDVSPIGEKKVDPNPKYKESECADFLSEGLKRSWLYDSVSEEWYLKRKNLDVYDRSNKIAFDRAVEEKLKPIKIAYSAGFLSGVGKLLCNRLPGEWTGDKNLLPMLNGYYDLKSKKLYPYNGKHRWSWALDYEYDSGAVCRAIDAWLDRITQNDGDLKKFLLCYCAAVLTGRSDLQKILVMVGPGGTGKGTLIRLLSRVVGKSNTWSTSLKKLEDSSYELANIYLKRLVIFTDSSGEFVGDMSIFKALFGGDDVPFEQKYKQARAAFTFGGMGALAANQYVSSSDKTSGLTRRIISVVLREIITEKEKAVNPNFEEILYYELPGFFNKLVSISRDTVTEVIRNPGPSIHKSKLEAELSTNPIAGWINDHVVVCDSGEETNIGTGPARGTLPNEYRLYPNYLTWCERQTRRPVSLSRFSDLVIDNCVSRGIDTRKGRRGDGTYLVGLRLRKPGDKQDGLLVQAECRPDEG